MGIFKRIFGICNTPALDPGLWNYAEGRVTIDLGQVGELAKPGGAVRLEGQGLQKRVLVFRGDDDQFYALENRCSHAGHRRLDPAVGEGKVRCCSIGKTEFDYQGNRLAGAGQDSIRPLAVEIDGQTLVVVVE